MAGTPETPRKGYASASKPVTDYTLQSGAKVTVRALPGQFDMTKPYHQAQPRDIDQSRHPWQARKR